LGKGDGTFGAKVEFPAGKNLVAVAIGDLDGDRKLDIVAANEDAGTVSVLLGKGDGTFAAWAGVTGRSWPRWTTRPASIRGRWRWPI
jgi:hypothetical protein